MSVVKERRNTIIISKPVKENPVCYHCGVVCINDTISLEDKIFCCEGCKLVYEIIAQNGMCDYYKLSTHPGLSQIKPLRSDKYAYLDNEEIASSLYKFTDGRNTMVIFYIPGVHCSSCMWLLEHLYKLDENITESRLNFSSKEITIRFDKQKITLRHIVELLARIGYDPYISLEDTDKKKINKYTKQEIYKLGIAGFCFGNIMLMSFPEYLSAKGIEEQYVSLFRILNLILSLPVFFYSASGFFINAWDGIKQKIINIDAPVSLAIIITFSRSLFEIITGNGAGYLDSMTGVVFFMLAGRMIQNRTYQSISFHRDYKSYFPIAVNIITQAGVQSCNLKDLKKGDTIEVYNGDIIPADGKITYGDARIDYSFVTGEAEPITKKEDDTVYAGGKQIGGKINILVTKPVAASYLTSLWNHHAFSQNKAEINKTGSFIHLLSKNFTIGLLILVAITGIYWAFIDPSKILPSISAMLIIACPCALLLASTFTNGSIMRLLSINGLYLRDAFVIEQIGKINHIVFDKTGTLTKGNNQLNCDGYILTEADRDKVFSVASLSKHPYSKALTKYLQDAHEIPVLHWKEIIGAGIEADIDGTHICIGSASFITVPIKNTGADFYVSVNNNVTAFYIAPDIRNGVDKMLLTLTKKYELSLLSGDNDKQKSYLSKIFGKNAQLLFRQKPIDKLKYIEALQQNNDKVLMIGDGLNDAGALQQSDAGITLADDINNFTPSCDAILDATYFSSLPALIKLSHAGRKIINLSFTISLIYNVVGLYFSIQAQMTPLLAAILMPLSTVSIVLITAGASNMYAMHIGLRTQS